MSTMVATSIHMGDLNRENFLTEQVHRWVIGKLFELLVVESFTSKQQFTFRENSCWNLELAVLSIIDLTMNQFEGPLSDNVGEAKSLAQLFLSHNQFSSELPATISESTSLVDIELGSNQFSGEIPATIGNLKKLSNLHLENNLFSGTIPESLGSCVSLSEHNPRRKFIFQQDSSEYWLFKEPELLKSVAQ
ncbi:hypothetical protein ACSBR2_019048 [Camellia fascicularis]